MVLKVPVGTIVYNKDTGERVHDFSQPDDRIVVAQGGRGGRGGARNRREEERERNFATFGEAGGVGLMGPGAYVGGWGGYGCLLAMGCG